ncbi:MAG: three-Cys-motif partner protein TcmP [Rhodospirillales bacterium]|nr:three-Cys-motif partner protein TcmP [Rhodospirillales bacterium]
MTNKISSLISENYRGREQSYVKHLFLENYIERVAYNILSFSHDFVFVDGFSGPWKSSHETLEDTSFGRATSKLRHIRLGLLKGNKDKKIRCLFIEEKKSRFTNLQKAASDIKDIEAVALQGAFESKVTDIIHYVGQSFSLIFIDPTGWSGFGLNNIKPILELKGEVIINFMFDYINRFMEDPRPETAKTFDPLFGDDTWYEEFYNLQKSGVSREDAVLQVYLRRLKKTGNFKHVTSTRIKHPLRDRTYFYLVYATRHSKGILEFRNVEKKAADIQEQVRDAAKQANAIEKRATKSGMDDLLGVTKQDGNTQDFTLERQRRLSQAKKIFVDCLNTATSIKIETLQGIVLEVPLVWPTDLNEWLAALRKSGVISIPEMKQKATIPDRKSIVLVHSPFSIKDI